jgi:hypothetical protein
VESHARSTPTHAHTVPHASPHKNAPAHTAPHASGALPQPDRPGWGPARRAATQQQPEAALCHWAHRPAEGQRQHRPLRLGMGEGGGGGQACKRRRPETPRLLCVCCLPSGCCCCRPAAQVAAGVRKPAVPGARTGMASSPSASRGAPAVSSRHFNLPCLLSALPPPPEKHRTCRGTS